MTARRYRIYKILSKKIVVESDWWDTISKKEKELIETGINQLQNGEGIDHKEVRKKVGKLLGKK